MSKKAILAVDDMAENLTAIRSILESTFDVRLAKTPTMALSLMDTVKFDLILLDIEMPGMDGFQFLKQMKFSYPESVRIPVIFVTSHASSDIIAKAVSAGGKDYIVKPVKADVLLKKIDALIGPEKKEFNGPVEEKIHQLLDATGSADHGRSEKLIKELLVLPQLHKYLKERVDMIAHILSRFDYEAAHKKLEDLLKSI